MLFEHTKVNLILDERELNILADAYDVLAELADEMYNRNFTLITINEFIIDDDELNNILQDFKLLTESKKLEVE